MSTQYNSIVDISGLDCGAPFAKLARAVDDLKQGEILKAVTGKMAMQNDIPSYCRQKKLELIEQGMEDRQYYFLIKKY